MSKHLKFLLLAALTLLLLAALPAATPAKTTYKTSTPVLSGVPTMGQDFSVSGVITPASTAKSRATVKVKLLMEMGGKYDVMDVYVAKLAKMPAGKKSTRYARTLNIPMTGSFYAGYFVSIFVRARSLIVVVPGAGMSFGAGTRRVRCAGVGLVRRAARGPASGRRCRQSL